MCVSVQQHGEISNEIKQLFVAAFASATAPAAKRAEFGSNAFDVDGADGKSSDLARWRLAVIVKSMR